MLVRSMLRAESQLVAERLRRTREAMKLNQADWCRLVGIEPQAWNNYERGRNRISIDQALKVCQATGASLDWIYRGLADGLTLKLATALQELRGSRNVRPLFDQDPRL
jgi:transcriptional regulator with XRE-family HTH domain